MRVLVCGGRNYSNAVRVMDEISALPSDGLTIVTGGARGADRLAESAAMTLGIPVEIHYAHWERDGKKAGVIRNQAMLDTGIDIVIAFPGGNGTADMVRRATRAGVTVMQVQEATVWVLIVRDGEDAYRRPEVMVFAEEGDADAVAQQNFPSEHTWVVEKTIMAH